MLLPPPADRPINRQAVLTEETRKLRPTRPEQFLEAAAVLASIVPTIGGPISGIVTSATSTRRWNRLLDFLESVETRLSGLEDLSDDQHEIATEILERVVREHSREKTSCYRNILLNGLRAKDMKYDQTMEMLKLVERLTPNHIKVLQVLKDPAAALKTLAPGAYEELRANAVVGLPSHLLSVSLLWSLLPDWPFDQLSVVWDELCDSRLIYGGSPHVQLPPADEKIRFDLVSSILCQHVSEFGHEFIRHVLES